MTRVLWRWDFCRCVLKGGGPCEIWGFGHGLECHRRCVQLCESRASGRWRACAGETRPLDGGAALQNEWMPGAGRSLACVACG
eukprot:11268539-Alexandrium_andersonii.AAC.1